MNWSKATLGQLLCIAREAKGKMRYMAIYELDRRIYEHE